MEAQCYAQSPFVAVHLPKNYATWHTTFEFVHANFCMNLLRLDLALVYWWGLLFVGDTFRIYHLRSNLKTPFATYKWTIGATINRVIVGVSNFELQIVSQLIGLQPASDWVTIWAAIYPSRYMSIESHCNSCLASIGATVAQFDWCAGVVVVACCR